jgi:Uma2 family endonuclease
MVTKTHMSIEEFEAVCERLGPCELVRGEVVLLSPGGFQHSRVAYKIGYLLGRWAEESQRGRLLTAEAGIIVETDPDTVRGADVAYFSYQRLPRGQEPDGFCNVPPELVVEVLGKG